MIIDLNDFDLVKGITRTEAKKVHKDLPEGGVWRTIRGHHVYLVNGKIVAGSIPGVTKAKKMTKATMAEHQAAVDAEGKKTNAKSKGKGTGKASKPAGKKSGSDSKGTGGAKKAKDSGSGKKGSTVDETGKKPKKAVSGKKSGSKPAKPASDKPAPAKSSTKTSKSGTKKSASEVKAPAKGKANGKTTKVGAKTDDKSAKPTAKSKTTGRTVSTAGAKKGASKPAADIQSKTPAEERLRGLASQSTDGMDMWANAHENPEDMTALREALKTIEGSGTKEKLDILHKRMGGGNAPEYAPDSTKKMDDFTPGKASVKPSDISISERTDGRDALASAPTGSGIVVHKEFKSNPEDTQKYVIAHETGHILSNAYPGLASHILDNPEGALGRVNNKRGRFEGVGGTASPEESWADAYSLYHTDPKWLKEHHPKAYAFVEAVTKKIPAHKKYLDKAFEELDKRNGKAPAKKAKDIRTDAQKNRELAYDVGDKVGGARKDDYEASFKANANAQSLEDLEKMSGAVAEKMVTKANLLPKFDYQQAKDHGDDLPTALLKKLIQDRIAPKPDPSTPESRKAYLNAINKVHRHFAGIKDYSQMREALRELSNMARKVQNGKDAEKNIKRYEENPSRFSYFNSEHHQRRLAEGKEAEKVMGFDVDALGEKFSNLLTNWESTHRTLDTVSKNARKGWDEYTTPKAKAAPKERGAENKKWVRKAEAEHLRTGGKETKVAKPEDLAKEFNLRGVEFGHWVNDSSGLYHLKRSAEALDDLSDVLGIDKKDISLNGRLALAFGARGKGTALAHYEPDRKVINMTKHGGAGSLAHEWGHAMDNILHQYSNGGTESLALASEGGMGNADPKLNMLYDHLMSTIMEPQDGVGHVKKVEVDSEANHMSSYYPSMRKLLTDNPNEEGVNKAKAWSYDFIQKATEKIETMKELVKRADNDYSRKHRTKELKKMESQLKSFKRDFPHMIASGMQAATRQPYKGTIEVPTGTTEYYNRMKETDGDKGKEYYAQPAEMFARVFESYVQDKLDKEKRYNNYLVHGTREGNVKVEGAPFPLGKEREQMFKAMDNLMQYVGSKGTLKKALMMEILASGTGDMTEVLRKSLGYTKRSAYNVANPEDVIYIPLNRLRTPYQTEKATNWDKVQSNYERMQRGEHLDPVSIGLDYDVHDGHHRIEAAKKCGHEHIPCVVKGGNDLERERAVEAYREVWKSFDESAHPRNNIGEFTKVYHTTKDPNFRHDPSYKNSGQEWGSGLYTAPAKDIPYWHKALQDRVTGERHPYVIPMDISEAKLIHAHHIPSDEGERQEAILDHYGDGDDALQALEHEEKEHVTGETYGLRPHEIAEYRVYAKMKGYDGIIAHDPKEGHQVVLFDDSKVKYGKAMTAPRFFREHT
jgi:hypothetical protein